MQESGTKFIEPSKDGSNEPSSKSIIERNRMNTNNQTTDSELITIELNQAYEMGEALKRLEKNPDFQKVVLDGYLKEKALASVSLISVPAIKEQGKRPEVIEDLIAISNLQYYLRMIHMFHEAALQDMEEMEAK